MKASRIMIVEDEAIVRRDIEQMILESGYQVVATASTAKEAINRAGNLKPDLILMDIVLKGSMDGIEAAEQIGKQCDIPIVFLTAYADKKKLRRAEISNTFGYIVKPVNESELSCGIEIALYKHRLEKGMMDQVEEYESFNALLLKREISIRELREENLALKHRLEAQVSENPEGKRGQVSQSNK